MITYAMIILLYSGYDASLTVINQEFTSAQNCEAARIFIAGNVSKSSSLEIISQGCFKK